LPIPRLIDQAVEIFCGDDGETLEELRIRSRAVTRTRESGWRLNLFLDLGRLDRNDQRID